MNKIIFILTLSAFLFSQQASVENVQVAQRTDGSKIVDITYDLLPDALFTEFTVSVELSLDGGNTWNETFYLQGDIDLGQFAGISKNIIWLFGQEYPNTFIENVQIRVIAEGYIYEEQPFEMVYIPAGEYTFGQNDEIRTIDYDYEIGKYEITNAQYALYLIEALEDGSVYIDGDVKGFYIGDENYGPGDQTLYTLDYNTSNDNYGRINWNGTTFIVPEGYGNHPVGYVTWFGANAFAQHYGMRLPTEYEWEKTARANTGADYPWGENLGEDISDNANYWNSGDPWDNGTTPTGFYNGQNYNGFQTTDSPSPYGAYDMAGNVWEWTNSWCSECPSGEFYWTNRVLRGGSLVYGNTFWWSGDGCHSWHRFGQRAPDFFANYIGFRVARTQ